VPLYTGKRDENSVKNQRWRRFHHTLYHQKATTISARGGSTEELEGDLGAGRGSRGKKGALGESAARDKLAGGGRGQKQRNRAASAASKKIQIAAHIPRCLVHG